MKLAICDDIEMYLKMIKEKIDSCLPDGPHGIDEFSSREELLENFEKGKYDAAILDMHMKKLNGIQTAEKICEIDNDIIISFHTNDDFCMDVLALQSAIKKDIANNKKPFAIIASAGTTNTGSVDPMTEISALVVNMEFGCTSMVRLVHQRYCLKNTGKSYMELRFQIV